MIEFLVNWAGVLLALFLFARKRSPFCGFILFYFIAAMALGHALSDQQAMEYMSLISSGYAESANYQLWRSAQNMTAAMILMQLFKENRVIRFYIKVVCLKTVLQASYAIELSMGSYWLFWPTCVIDHLSVIIEIITMILVTDNRVSRLAGRVK